jgi:hypothetical protein
MGVSNDIALTGAFYYAMIRDRRGFEPLRT